MIVSKMAKTAVAFAVKNKISLGQDVQTGHYYIVDHDNGTPMFGQLISDVSNKGTAQSAITMMKRHIRICAS